MTALAATLCPATAPPADFLDVMLGDARARGRRRIGMVFPGDRSSLETALRLALEGIAEVTLIGPRERMLDIGRAEGLVLSGLHIVDSGQEVEDAARMACQLVASGDIDLLMKGSLHTDTLMRSVVSRSAGLRTSRRVSHAFAMQVQGRQTPLILADCVVNVAPTLHEKVHILEHAVQVAKAIGVACPRVALLSFTESVMPGAPSTLEAAALAKMAERGQIRGALIDGPLAFDNAVSPASASAKGIDSAVAGHADILVVPNLESGNALYKSLVYMAGASCAGVVLGARCPVVLTSRTDSLQSKVYSAALASIMLSPV
ncbi:MAG TPA: bifunctional enoyl-CoA hydratase/phosphate acetyltransferase [Burkholderiaceae bacterium]|nr:bifunctional enoyl-CoA hydratase/phosphate acetyltransferase [Burkholderiaceae bacterium]